MNSSITKNNISDYGLLVVFTPMTKSISRFNTNLTPHLVCSVCYVNVNNLFGNITRKSQQIETEKAASVSSVFSKIMSLNIPALENVKDVENQVIKKVLAETVQVNPDFFLFYINFAFPLFKLNKDPASGVEFIPISAYSFFKDLIPPFFFNLNNSSDNIDHQFSKSDINKFVFLFRGINWPVLQELFRNKGIAISGGIGSKRVFLSTSNYFLSKFLSHIGYESTDIYNSYKQSRDFEFNIKVKIETVDFEILKLILINLNILDLNLKLDMKSDLEYKISNDEIIFNNTSSRFSGFGAVGEKQARKNNNKLNKMKEALQNQSKELSQIESEIVKLEEENKLLQSPNLSFNNVISLYNDRFRGKHINNFVLDIKKKIKHYMLPLKALMNK